jgi:hypothetical protein
MDASGKEARYCLALLTITYSRVQEAIALSNGARLPLKFQVASEADLRYHTLQSQRCYARVTEV